MEPEKRARSGAWLKRAREAKGISVRKIAAHFDVSTQSVYGWEAGASDFVDDDRASGLAAVLGMDLLEVRRGLGLWVPQTDREGAGQPGEITATALADRLRRDPDFRRRVFDELVSGSGQGGEVNQSDTEGDSDSSVA